jgi:hypothetical protein
MAKSDARPLASRQEKAKLAGLSKNEQRELDGIMDKIDEAERAAAAVEAELADPSLYAAGQESAKVAEIRARLDAAKALAAKLTTRWEDLEAKKSAS